MKPTVNEYLTQCLALSQHTLCGEDGHLTTEVLWQLVGDVHAELQRRLAERSVCENAERSAHAEVVLVERQFTADAAQAF